MSMPRCAASHIPFRRLARSFDAEDLARDLAGIAEDDWVVHFNAGYHNGGWSGVTLRGVDGDTRQLFPGDAQTTSYTNTPLWRCCPRIAAAMQGLLCPVGPIRLLRLSAGGQIREHRDAGLSMELGLARLHIPVLTGSEVEFYLGADLVTMAPGECWYLNFDLPHRVQNLGAADRVHLVIDCVVNDWLREQILAGDVGSSDDRRSSQLRFDRFRARVVGDPALIAALWPIEQAEGFAERVVALGQRFGFAFTTGEVAAAMREGGQAGSGRWIVQ